MRWPVVVLLAACSSPREEPGPPATPGPPALAARDAAPRPRGTTVADSTIAARDYVGPDACAECHPDQHRQWATSLHAVMNQRAGAPAVIGDFATTLAYRGGTARFTRERGDYVMVTGDVRYRVTRTIGRRGLQEYVGIAAGAPEPPSREAPEVRLPFGWWPRRGGWYPQPYFDPWLAEDAFDPYAQVREPWAERCPWCHSTYPFAQRIARASRANVGHGLEQFFELAAAPDATPAARLDTAAQVTVGISCESCHLGGRAHAAGAPIHFVPIGAAARPGAPAPTTFARERADAAIANRVCAQCHSGPSPRLPDGTATRNSSEALDLAASPCTTARCTDCHDPHVASARGVDERARAACTRCHERFADPAAARTHAGHADATCLDCHMPRVVMGIDGYVRTHRISSPTDPAMLAAGAPNACNLCHLDRPIAWTAAELRRGHEVRLPARALARYGDEPVGDVWLASPEPAIRLVAAHAFARSPLGRDALPRLLELLDDPIPYVRAFATFAVEDVLGRRLTDAEYDPRLPAGERRRQLAKLGRR